MEEQMLDALPKCIRFSDNELRDGTGGALGMEWPSWHLLSRMLLGADVRPIRGRRHEPALDRRSIRTGVS
jgi:hypothetical protein